MSLIDCLNDNNWRKCATPITSVKFTMKKLKRISPWKTKWRFMKSPLLSALSSWPGAWFLPLTLHQASTNGTIGKTVIMMIFRTTTMTSVWSVRCNRQPCSRCLSVPSLFSAGALLSSWECHNPSSLWARYTFCPKLSWSSWNIAVGMGISTMLLIFNILKINWTMK